MRKINGVQNGFIVTGLLIISIFIVLGVIFLPDFIKAKDEQQLETVQPKDFLVTASKPSWQIAYVTKIEKHSVQVVFRIHGPSIDIPLPLIAQGVERVIKKDDTYYAATAALFAQQ